MIYRRRETELNRSNDIDNHKYPIGNRPRLIFIDETYLLHIMCKPTSPVSHKIYYYSMCKIEKKNPLNHMNYRSLHPNTSGAEQAISQFSH